MVQVSGTGSASKADKARANARALAAARARAAQKRASRVDPKDHNRRVYAAQRAAAAAKKAAQSGGSKGRGNGKAKTKIRTPYTPPPPAADPVEPTPEPAPEPPPPEVVPGNWWALDPLENLRTSESFASDITMADIDGHIDSSFANTTGDLGTIRDVPPAPVFDPGDGTTDQPPPNTNTFSLAMTPQELKGVMLIGAAPYTFGQDGFAGVGSPEIINGFAVWDVQIDLPDTQGFASYEVRLTR